MLVSPIPRPARRPGGYTILELMVALALGALALGLAAPALDSLIARQRLRAASFDLLTDLTLARSESLKRASTVDLRPVDNQSDWRAGWTLSTVDGQVLTQRPALGGALRIVNAPPRVQFNDQGRVDADTQVRFALIDGHGGERCITLDPSGRPRSVAAGCSP